MGLGSGIRKKPIPNHGVKKAPELGSATLYLYIFCLLLPEGTFTSFFKDKKSKKVTK
jgi:hypothetical protein